MYYAYYALYVLYYEDSCFVIAVEKCGGQIYSAGKPVRFPSTQQVSSCMKCKWLIVVSPKKKVKLTLRISLGPGDKLHVSDGYSNKSPLIATYEEGFSSVDIVSSGSSMTVVVTTDGCGSNSIVSASFKPLDNASCSITDNLSYN